MRTTYRSTQTRTVNHSSKSRTQLAQQHCCEPHDLSLMILGLENSPYSTSLVRPRLKAAIANPSKCPVYHLQMHRSSSAQLLFTEAATPTRIEEHILLCTRCVPGYFAGASRLSEGRVRHACSVCEAREERGIVPASRFSRKLANSLKLA